MRSAKKATVLENFRRAETVQHPPLGGYAKRKSAKSYDSTLFFGALVGTRIPGPLIKRTFQATFVKSVLLEISSFAFHVSLCIHNTGIPMCKMCAKMCREAIWTNRSLVLRQGSRHTERPPITLHGMAGGRCFYCNFIN